MTLEDAPSGGTGSGRNDTPPRHPNLVSRLLVMCLTGLAVILVGCLGAQLVLWTVYGEVGLVWLLGWMGELNERLPPMQVDPGLFTPDFKTPVTLGVTGLSAGALVGVWGSLTKSSAEVVGLLLEDEKPWRQWCRDLLRTTPPIILAVATIMTGAVAVFNADDGSSSQGPKLPVLAFDAPGGSESLLAPGAVIHLLFDEGVDSLGAGDEPQRDFLESLAATMLACSSDQDDPVRVSVRGYASSSGTNDGNVTLANDRAEWVANSLTAFDPSGSVRPEIEVEAHQAYPTVAAGMISDWVSRNATYSLPAGALNRRVEIRFESLGACS